MNKPLTISKHDKVLTFIPDKFIPMSFADFVSAERAGDNFYNVKAEISGFQLIQNGQSQLVSRKGIIDIPINFARSIPIYALVEGGWLPPPFVSPLQLHLDRNVIGAIEQILKGNQRDPYLDTAYWLQMSDRDDMIVSPYLYAFESNLTTAPGYEEFVRGYEEGAQIIKELFPKALVPTYGDEGYGVLYRFAEDVLAAADKEMTYLLRAVPLIRNIVASQRRRKVAAELFELAAELGVKFHSIPLLATLSCLYENYAVTGFNAAREMLKIRGGEYTEARAYNALSDMRSLLIYLAFRAMAKQDDNYPYAYCTGDKAALLFGCGLNIVGERFRDGKLYMSFDLAGPLFPDIPEDERSELFKRIEAAA